MQRLTAWVMLVVIATVIAVIDPRSLISVFVCVAPVLVELIAAPKSRQQPNDSDQPGSIEK